MELLSIQSLLPFDGFYVIVYTDEFKEERWIGEQDADIAFSCISKYAEYNMMYLGILLS